MTSTTRAALTILLAGAAQATAQEQPPTAPTTTATPAQAENKAEAPRAEAKAEAAPEWGFDVSVFTVNPPDADAFASTVLSADRDWLHLEGRWNYEALHTGSLFVGRNFEWSDESDEFGLSVVPMAGVVVGDIDGAAPGFELDATWKWLEFYDESEYVVSTNDHHDNFIYSWAELTVAPVDWLKFGLAAQRTTAYDTELSVDRGPLLSLSFKKVTGTIYWFNPDKSGSYVVFTLGFSF